MAFKGNAKRAWREGYREKQRAQTRDWHDRKRAERAAAVLALPAVEAAGHYLRAMGFHGKAQSIVAQWARSHPGHVEVERLAQLSADRRYRRRLRDAAIELLGGRCECCGIDIPEVLEFDHRDAVRRRTAGMRNRDTAHSAREIVQGKADLYQLLCANCHAIKTKANGEHVGGQGTDAWSDVMAAWSGGESCPDDPG